MLPLQRTLPLRAWMVGFFTAASDSAKDAEALASAGEEMISFQKIFSMKALRLPSDWPACSHAVRTSMGILPIEVVVPVAFVRELGVVLPLVVLPADPASAAPLPAPPFQIASACVWLI